VTGLLPVAVPYPLRLLLTITIEVLLMTYWLMPQLTRRLARWIYPGASPSPDPMRTIIAGGPVALPEPESARRARLRDCALRC